MAKSGDTALAGRDGKELARLIRQAKDDGADTLHYLTRQAVSRYAGIGPLFNPLELDTLAESLAAVNSAADLLGRYRVREIADTAVAAGGQSRLSEDKPWANFADELPRNLISTPEEALSYFLSLSPSIGVDPGRFPDEQRRRAFTLAASTNQTLTARVQQEIADGLRNSLSVQQVTDRLRDSLADAPKMAGTSPGGKETQFIPHPNATERERTIIVDPKKLAGDWEKTSGGITPTGEGQSKGKLQGVEDYLKTGKPLQASRGYLDANGEPDLSDGRHRLRTLADLGYDQMAITVPRKDAEEFERRYGVDKPKVMHSQYACFLPGTIVEGDVEAASKAMYSGPAVEIETDAGRRLSVTIHHPVLTSDGWKDAGCIQEGEYLIGYAPGIESFSGGTSERGAVNYQNRPTRIEDVFESIAIEGTSILDSQRPVSPLDFHGDAVYFEGKINAVRPDGELWRSRNPKCQECGGKFRLVKRNIPSANLAVHGCGLFNARGKTSLDAGLIHSSGSSCESSGFGVWRENRPLHSVGFGSAANLNPSVFHASDKRSGGDVQLARKLIVSFPGLITTDRVVKVKRIEWTGHVYDLQTRSKFIVSDGIITSNSMVYRTNANDSFQTATYEEGRHRDVAGVFPAWQYLIVDDERTGDDHRPKGDRYYPADATFVEVRGNRPYNCRCSMRWIDFMDWQALQAKGYRTERRW